MGKPEVRILCLTIDSDPMESWRETYEVHRHYWQRCFDACPWVDGFFVRADPNLDDEYAISGRTFTFRGRESLDAILYKVAKAIDILMGDHHACIVRTGLSSLYDFKALRTELPLPAGTYAGHLVHGYGETYVSGAGMVLSPNAARTLASGTKQATSEFDDIAVAQILRMSGVVPQERLMWMFDYKQGLYQIEDIELGKHTCYRFRDYGDPHRAVERDVMQAVFRKVYG